MHHFIKDALHYLDFPLPRDNSTNVHTSVRRFVWYFHNTKSNLIWEGTHNNRVKKEGNKLCNLWMRFLF